MPLSSSCGRTKKHPQLLLQVSNVEWICTCACGAQRKQSEGIRRSKIKTLYIKANIIFIHVIFLKITRVDPCGINMAAGLSLTALLSQESREWNTAVGAVARSFALARFLASDWVPLYCWMKYISCASNYLYSCGRSLLTDIRAWKWKSTQPEMLSQHAVIGLHMNMNVTWKRHQA